MDCGLDLGASEIEASRSASAARSSAVRFDKVSFAFDEHVVLRDVSFGVPKGSIAILLGPSGAGKSVTLKLILGLFRSDSATFSSTANASPTSIAVTHQIRDAVYVAEHDAFRAGGRV